MDAIEFCRFLCAFEFCFCGSSKRSELSVSSLLLVSGGMQQVGQSVSSLVAPLSAGVLSSIAGVTLSAGVLSSIAGVTLSTVVLSSIADVTLSTVVLSSIADVTLSTGVLSSIADVTLDSDLLPAVEPPVSLASDEKL